MPRGGYREGSGRKPADESGAQSPIQVWVSPALLERLDAAKDALGISRSAVLEMGVKEAERRAKRAAGRVGESFVGRGKKRGGS